MLKAPPRPTKSTDRPTHRQKIMHYNGPINSHAERDGGKHIHRTTGHLLEGTQHPKSALSLGRCRHQVHERRPAAPTLVLAQVPSLLLLPRYGTLDRSIEPFKIHPITYL